MKYIEKYFGVKILLTYYCKHVEIKKIYMKLKKKRDLIWNASLRRSKRRLCIVGIRKHSPRKQNLLITKSENYYQGYKKAKEIYLISLKT